MGWMGGWIDGWLNAWVDGWMDGWMDKYSLVGICGSVTLYRIEAFLLGDNPIKDFI